VAEDAGDRAAPQRTPERDTGPVRRDVPDGAVAPDGDAKPDGVTAPATEPEARDTTAEKPATELPDTGLPAWATRGLIVLAVLVVLIVVGLALAAFLPRWWAHRIGRVADGSLTAGIAAGLTCGVVFTAAALLALREAVRRGRRWRARAWFLALAVLVAVPNLITLGIVIGSGNAAHAGERTLDVDGPGFRGATLVGCILGAIAMALLWYALSSRRHQETEIARLRAELALARRDAAEARDGGPPQVPRKGSGDPAGPR
jgi:nucleotide-binding universal stress UspA family protein